MATNNNANQACLKARSQNNANTFKPENALYGGGQEEKVTWERLCGIETLEGYNSMGKGSGEGDG
jgi:hypothetical protein